MIINLKKIALGIMTTGGLLVPLSVMASCNSSDVVDYKITAKSDPKLVRADISGENYKTLSTLEKVFDDLDADKLKNLTVKKDAINEGTIYKITLTANEGYTINEKSTLESNNIPIPDESLDITAKDIIPQELNRDEVDSENLKTLPTLRQLFNLSGITQSYIDEGIEVQLKESTSRSGEYFVLLTAKIGFNINGLTSIPSKSFDIKIVDLAIQSKSSIDGIVNPADIAGENFKNYSLLMKLFEGPSFNAKNLENLNIEMETHIEGSVYRIKISPKKGFTINGGTAILVSANFPVGTTDFAISAIVDVPSDITEEDIRLENIGTRVFLRKLFEINDLQQLHLDEGINASLVEVTSGRVYKITLTAKTGFTINGA
ncbi:MAG: hypothetical protein ACRCXE_01825, partial [Metamycoplasmataceae bacterium]